MDARALLTETTRVARYERGPNAETLAALSRVLQVELDFLLLGEVKGREPNQLPIADVPLLERFRDIQKLPKRDRKAVILLIDGVLTRGDVETRLRKRA